MQNQAHQIHVDEQPANCLDIGDPLIPAELAHATRVKNSLNNIVQFRAAFARRADALTGALERFKERRQIIGKRV